MPEHHTLISHVWCRYRQAGDNSVHLPGCIPKFGGTGGGPPGNPGGGGTPGGMPGGLIPIQQTNTGLVNKMQSISII